MMDFDRYRVKNMAKGILHDAQPRPWPVALVYRLLTLVLPLLLFFFIPLAVALSSIALLPYYSAQPQYQHQYQAPSILSVILLLVFLLVCVLIFFLHAGYFHYCLCLWRGEQGGLRSLFRGFSCAPRLLALLGFILLFSLLWLLPALAVMAAAVLVLQHFQSPELSGLFAFLLELGLMAYILNRVLRYALAVPLLLDHPDHTARQALNESKSLMAGKRWRLCVLYLSFWGWLLVACLVFYFSMFVAWLPVAAVFSSRLSTVPASPEDAFPLLWLLLLVTLSLAFLLSAPLRLWLTGYMGVSFAGFYDLAIGRPLVPKAPPWKGQEDTPSPAEPFSPPPSAPDYMDEPYEPWNRPQ